MANVNKRGFQKVGASSYTRNALDGFGGQEYFVSVDKESASCWVIFAEDHEPSDIQAHLGHDDSSYPTLSTALDAAVEFSEDYVELWEENVAAQ